MSKTTFEDHILTFENKCYIKGFKMLYKKHCDYNCRCTSFQKVTSIEVPLLSII